MEIDVAIIGGGVIGCAVLNKLTRLGVKAVVVEKNTDVGTVVSKANSGLIHAGYDPIPGTLKAKLNAKGTEKFARLAKELDLEYKQTGSLVVGNDLAKLEELRSRGIKNGVPGLVILSGEVLYEKVPNLKRHVKHGLFAPTAGIVFPYKLTIALAEEAVLNGGKVLLNYNVTGITKQDDSFIIKGTNGNEEIKAKYIVNCAGHGYNEIAKMLSAEQYNITHRRGEYYVLDKTAAGFVNMPIFPLPTELSKGILATPTIDGNILLGPTSSNSDTGTETSFLGLREIRVSIDNMFDNVPWNKVIRTYAGVRDNLGKDFLIEKSKYTPGVINVCGINSPGLSCVVTIGEYIAELLGYPIREKPMKRRKEITQIAKLPESQVSSLIRKQPAYGNIICRCELVSEAEIVNAIHSPVPTTTLDGIKRRVRPGMGRCQGGFCTIKVCEILARELNKPLDEIIKENKNSNIFGDDIKQTEFFNNSTKK